jgi:hypothetical protein
VTNRVAAGATARSDGGGSKPEVEEEDGTRIAGCFERPIGSECERINSEKKSIHNHRRYTTQLTHHKISRSRKKLKYPQV